MKRTIKLDRILGFFLSALFCAAAYAECQRNLEGFSNNVDANPTHSAAASGARTTDDFQVATANFFFFSEAGQNYVDSAIANPSFFRALGAMWNGTFETASGFHSVPVCSDVGQCVQGGIGGIFGQIIELPDSSIPIEIRGVEVSVPIDGGTESQLSGFLVVAWDSSGNSSSQEYSLAAVETRQAAGNVPYDMPSEGTPDEAQEGDACRDNDGNEVNEDGQPTGSGGGGAGEGVGTEEWTTPNPWDSNGESPSGGQCYECWSTPTGVACRQVALAMCQ